MGQKKMSCQSGGALTKPNMTGRWQKNVVHPAGLPRRVNRVKGYRKRAAVELFPRRPNNLPPGSFSPHCPLSLRVFPSPEWPQPGRTRRRGPVKVSTSVVWFSVLDPVQLCLSVLPSARGSLRAHLCCRHTDSVISCRSEKTQLKFQRPTKTKGATR